jgi:drug/metabolite transporter (DMT)-like permease
MQSSTASTDGNGAVTGSTTSTPTTIAAGAKPSRWGILFSLFALYIIWGSTYLGMRIALTGFAPFWMAAIRFLIAGIILYVVLRLRGTPHPTRAQWIGAGIVGILLLAGGNAGVAFAEQWVASGLAALGLAAIPLWTALFAGLWGRWPNRLEWFGLGIGFIGVILLNVGNNIWASPAGAIALLLAPICWALGSAWSQHIKLPTGLMSSASQMLVGGAALVVISLGVREPLPTPTVSSLLAIGFLIVFGSLIAFSAYGYLLRNVRPALATSYAYVNPMVAVGLGVLLDGEHITPLGLFAMFAIIAGVCLLSFAREKYR